MPPTTLKLFADMPKNWKSNCPVKANTRIVTKEMIEAFLAVIVLCVSVRLAVIDMNTGMVPNGLIRVNKEVKLNRANDKISVM